MGFKAPLEGIRNARIEPATKYVLAFRPPVSARKNLLTSRYNL